MKHLSRAAALRGLTFALGLLWTLAATSTLHAADRPNVLWLVSDDHAA